MTNIVPSTGAGLPSPPPPGIDRAVAYLSNKLLPVGLGHELPANEAPTAEQRRGLERRLERLAGWLAPFWPAEDQDVRDELYALLSTRKGDTPVGDARAIVAIYVQDLRDLPLHAIRAACLDFRHARVPGDRGFRPPQGDIRRQAQQHLHALATEQRRIRAILDAKVVEPRRPDPAHRAEVAAAARRSFGIPEGGLGKRTAPHAPAGEPGSIGAVTSKLFPSLNDWRRPRGLEPGYEGPEDRFTGEAAE